MSLPINGVLLDTSIIVRVFRGDDTIDERLASCGIRFLPNIALGELYGGAFRSARAERNCRQIEDFLAGAEVLLTDQITSSIYGQIDAQLARSGTPIPQNDVWIAALALQFDLRLVTADRHYRHVEGLRLLLW